MPAELSRGQQSKLAFAKLLLANHDLLILDEPTNHLDIATKEQLENALQNYAGAILVASHDVYFLQQLQIDKTLNLVDGKDNRIMKHYIVNLDEARNFLDKPSQVKDYSDVDLLTGGDWSAAYAYLYLTVKNMLFDLLPAKKISRKTRKLVATLHPCFVYQR
jgi:energy-coupling factor transporter ATP-binding protein EcfA2